MHVFVSSVSEIKVYIYKYHITFCPIFTLRLREIEMSEYDASVYEKFSGNVQSQVKSIRIMLDSLQVSCMHSRQR